MNRNVLKFIAVIAMFLDHAAFLLVPSYKYPELYFAMRCIGRLTAPIMCWFLTEGFIHTSSRLKYAIRLFVFALIAQIPFSLVVSGKPFSTEFNMIFTMFLCFIMLWAGDKIQQLWIKLPVMVVLSGLTAFCDWPIFGPLMVIIFYYFRENRKCMILLYVMEVAVIAGIMASMRVMKGFNWYGELWHLGMLGFIPLMFAYNGQPGARNFFTKWFFYVFYPAHLLLIWWLGL